MMHLDEALDVNEPLAVFSERGEPVRQEDNTLLAVAKRVAHQFGIPHCTSNVLLVCHDRSRRGNADVIIQKRARNIRIFPGAWTLSCGGHMEMELDPVPVAI